jgi:hypothetical protein
MGVWVDLTNGLDAVEKRKILHSRELNPGRPEGFRVTLLS